MEGIITAILDMESRAESALDGIRREKDKLPVRIEAKAEHIRRTISREIAAAIKELHEESEKFTASQIRAIQEESIHQLTAIESEFNARKEEIRKNLFQELTKWMP